MGSQTLSTLAVGTNLINKRSSSAEAEDTSPSLLEHPHHYHTYNIIVPKNLL